jgi:hypothetical protein
MLNEIKELKSKGDVENLFALLQSNKDSGDKDWMLRLDAAEALAQLGDKRGLDYLNQMMISSNKDIQEVASEILDELKDYQSEPILQAQVINQSNPNNLIYKINSKYPYLISWIAFISLYFVVTAILSPVVTLFWVIVPTWVTRSISSLTALLLNFTIGFFVFRFVIKKLVLPYKNKD